MKHGLIALGMVVGMAVALPAGAQTEAAESPRSAAIRLKLGGYKPRSNIDGESGLTSRPYYDTFGSRGMLLFEIAYEHYLWQGMGALGAGLSAGYAEKYAAAVLADNHAQTTSERTALQVFPLRLQAVYNFDYPALHLSIPLVPYVRAGVAYVPWRVTKGAGIERVGDARGLGAKWGVSGSAGLALLLDVLEPRVAADFDADVGVNHTYLFAEYDVLRTDLLFGGGGLNLSSHQWMFGLNLEF